MFLLSRSVRQGFPLAPCFYFFVEAMLNFLRMRMPQIHGLRMPLTIDEKLLDSEFADDNMLYVPYSDDTMLYVPDSEDTILYVPYSEEPLHILCGALDTFC